MAQAADAAPSMAMAQQMVRPVGSSGPVSHGPVGPKLWDVLDGFTGAIDTLW